jgi:hypothetical protein
LNGVLEKIPEQENEGDDEEELVPLSVARSISMPLKSG